MTDNGDNFGGTKLVGENGEQMDPAIAGISPPSIRTMEPGTQGAAVGVDLEDDDAARAKAESLDDEDHEADVTASGAE